MKEKNINLFVFLLVFFLFVVGSTYAFLNLNLNNNTTATGEGGCFNVSYEGTTINESNLESVDTYTDTTAVSTVSLNKDSSCMIYTEASICLHRTDPVTTSLFIDNPSFRYTVTHSGDIVSEDYFKSAQRGYCDPGDTYLENIVLTDRKEDYLVYIWIDRNTSNGTFHDASFNGYIYAASNQSSTVK